MPYEYYSDEDGDWLLEFDSNGAWISEKLISSSTGGYYGGFEIGAFGGVTGAQHVWGGDTFGFIGVGTPGFSIDGGYSADGDLSGLNVNVDVPIGPGQLTVDPTGSDMPSYAVGPGSFGTFGVSATYAVNLNDVFQTITDIPHGLAREFVNTYYPPYDPVIMP